MIKLKSEEEIAKLRVGGKHLAQVIAETAKLVKPGVMTAELNDFAHKMILDLGDTPAFLNFTPSGANRPYPAALCVSINEQIVHGIPNEDPVELKEGDIVSIDTGLAHEGMIVDHAITVPVGEVAPEVKKLLTVTKEALASAIKQAQPGNRTGDIGAVIEAQAEKNGLAVIEGLSGHGVGYTVHEEPYVPNQGRAGTGDVLEVGLVIAIEPMFSLGSHKIKLEKDGYTYSTADKSLSAQFEHTIVITKNGPEILTKV